eukprot:TRINITY_DN88_c0_g2_i1.p1 TRINITY_DN88_c0_g2~~TRINITY_DN88_c0_g2_i1.p1  ORF type:complete len:223 (+),score=75.87 TRINITY_DN88_c0_g2_i1:76-744(+)
MAVQIAEGTYEIICAHSGKALDVEGASEENCARIIQYQRTGGENQRFEIQHRHGHYYSIHPQHVEDNMALDVDGGSHDDEAQIIQYEFHGNDNQLFSFEYDGHGAFSIRCKASHKYLDISGGGHEDCAPLIQYRHTGGSNQKFYLHMTSPDLEGTYAHSSLAGHVSVNEIGDGVWQASHPAFGSLTVRLLPDGRLQHNHGTHGRYVPGFGIMWDDGQWRKIH